MDFLTRRNVAIVALLQIGLIVFGCLLAFAAMRWHESSKVHSMSIARVWANFGWIGLVVPLAWVSVASYVLESDDWSNSWKVVAFVSGLVLLAAILMAMWHGFAFQWFVEHGHGGLAPGVK